MKQIKKPAGYYQKINADLFKTIFFAVKISSLVY